MLGKIWERYFIQEFLRMLFLFLFCFYGLYVLIDYASHTSALTHHHIHIQWNEVSRYYLYVFAARAEILVPLALLIAFVYTVCTMNAHQELVALMASGIKIKTLMRPFLFIGVLCMLLMYANEQYLMPDALKKLRRMEDATKHQRKRNQLSLAVRQLYLEDGSLLVYQDYDSSKERFFDVYWIQSLNRIFRMKYLSPYLDIPKGYFVDEFKRQPTEELLQVASFEELPFPEMQFNREYLQSAVLDPEVYSLSDLAVQSTEVSQELSEKESKVLTAFYWKLTMPWLCLLAIIAPAPFCVRFSRQQQVFLIYVCSLFGLIAFYMLMDAAQVIAKRQVFPPFWAILGPFFGVFGFFEWRYWRIG